MSTHIAEVVRFRLERHTNADSLSVAVVKGWEVVVKTSDFELSDHYKELYENLGVYIPPDMIADKDHPLLGFLEGKKIKIKRLRGIYSQGVLLPLKKVVDTYNLKKLPEVGDDLTEILQVKRWEEPINISKLTKTKERHAEIPRPSFLAKYTDVENWNNYPNIIEEGEEVVITEKIDGSSAVFSITDDKFYVCSMNRVLRLEPTSVYVPRFKYRKFNLLVKKLKLEWLVFKKEIVPVDKTIWHRVAEKYKLEEILRQIKSTYDIDNIALYGEVVPTQKRGGKVFHYSHNKTVISTNNTNCISDVGLFIFDIRLNTEDQDKYLPQLDTINFCKEFNIPHAPLLYTGPFKKEVLELRFGKSSLTEDHIREGIVIQPKIPRYDRKLGRVILKKRSEDFLMIE